MARWTDLDELIDAFSGWAVVLWDDAMHMECGECGAWILVSCREEEVMLHMDASTVLNVILSHTCGEQNTTCSRHMEEATQEDVDALIDGVEQFLGGGDT